MNRKRAVSVPLSLPLSVPLGVMLLALAAGCSRQTVDGTKTDTGLLTGYELGNAQDQAEERESRPSGYTYE